MQTIKHIRITSGQVTGVLKHTPGQQTKDKLVHFDDGDILTIDENLQKGNIVKRSRIITDNESDLACGVEFARSLIECCLAEKATDEDVKSYLSRKS